MRNALAFSLITLNLSCPLLQGFRAPVLLYDVVSQPISIHLPLSRFMAALVLGLQRFNLDLSAGELSLKNNQELLTELMEPVLRLKVLIAQVSGWW